MEANAAFVSYSRKDSGFVKKLVNDLKAGGASVWFDQVDIQPGTGWDTAVQHALNECPQMLLVLSPTSAASANVLDEISVALRTNKTILPILHEDCEIPIRVSRLQYIDFRKDYAAALEQLLEQLRIHQALDSGRAPMQKKNMRWIWVTAAAVAVLISAVIYWFNSGSASQDTSSPQAASTGSAASGASSSAEAPSSQTGNRSTTGVDLKLRGLLGATGDEAKAYLGSQYQWTRDAKDGNKVLLSYFSRGLTVELDSPHGKVDSLCFEQPGNGFTGNSGEPVQNVSPGMSKSAIKSVLGSPSGGADGADSYSFFNPDELSGKTVEVAWAPGDAADPVALRVCINQD